MKRLSKKGAIGATITWIAATLIIIFILIIFIVITLMIRAYFGGMSVEKKEKIHDFTQKQTLLALLNKKETLNGKEKSLFNAIKESLDNFNLPNLPPQMTMGGIITYSDGQTKKVLEKIRDAYSKNFAEDEKLCLPFKEIPSHRYSPYQTPLPSERFCLPSNIESSDKESQASINFSYKGHLFRIDYYKES